MTSVLHRIASRKKQDVLRARVRQPWAVMRRAARRMPPARRFKQALLGPGVSLIAELKKASPSAGVLRPLYDPATGARQYARGGAAALSVLTEEHEFLGSPAHLSAVKRAVGLPVLRKDFIVDAYQIAESRACGADAVLLIKTLLSDALLRSLLREVRAWGMTAVVEVHDADELTHVLAGDADVIGINSRNLKDLSLDAGLFARLAAAVPAGRVLIAESGIHSPADVRRIKQAGAHAMLVGESLLRQRDLEAAARCLAAAGR